jgi:hypothetical protein
MANFGKRVDIPGGKRRLRRNPVTIAGSASTLHGSSCILIENLCFSGAQVRGRELPMEGSEILLRRDDKAIHGRVAWADGDRRGIVFNGARRLGR